MSDSDKRIAPFGLRLAPDLKERVQGAARAANRSLNAEISHRLERSFDLPDISSVTDTQFWKAFIEVAVEKEIEKRALEKSIDRLGGFRP